MAAAMVVVVVYGRGRRENGRLRVTALGDAEAAMSPSLHSIHRSPTQDGEIGVIGTGGCSLDVSRMEKSSHTEDILLSPAPYAHWTIMECLQQPEAIARALAFGGTIWDMAKLRSLLCSNIIGTGTT